MSIGAPPTQQPMFNDQSGFPALPWIVFFNGIYNGDAGIAWTPSFLNLQSTGGAPKVTGRVYQLSQYLSCFKVDIVPAQSVSGTAGQCVITNYPLNIQGNGICFAVSGLLGEVGGMVDQQSGGIFPPTFSNITVPITIMGFVEASKK